MGCLVFEKALLDEKKQSLRKPMAIALLFETAVIVLLVFAPLFFKTKDLNKFVFVEQVFLPPKFPPGQKAVLGKKTSSSVPKRKEKQPFQAPTIIPMEVANDGKSENKNTEEESVEVENGVVGENTEAACTNPNCVPGGTGKPENKKIVEEKENKKEEKPPEPEQPRIGGKVKQAKLIHKVEPIYPPLARKSKVQGDVILEAIIGTDGATHNIKIINPHPPF